MSLNYLHYHMQKTPSRRTFPQKPWNTTTVNTTRRMSLTLTT